MNSLLTYKPALNIFTDVVLATLPVPVVWNLQMKLKLRLYVIGILSLGYLFVEPRSKLVQMQKLIS